MKNFFFFLLLLSATSYAQVGLNTTTPQAMLDINGDLRIREVAEDLTSSKILVLGNNNIVYQGKAASFFALSDFVIPICTDKNVNDTGSFTTVANGTTYTISWEILFKTTGTNNFPVISQRLQVKYEFSPNLPFNPDGFNLTAYNNSSYPDTFSLNYTDADDTAITVNITRTDISSADENDDCWAGQFFFDMMMYKY